MKLKTLLVLTLAALSLSAVAADKKYGTTSGTDSMYINDFELKAGDSVEVAVNFSTVTQYSATQGDVTFGNPEIIPVKHYDENAEDYLYFSLTSRINPLKGFVVADNYFPDKNMIRWVEYNGKNKLFAKGDAPFLTIWVKATKNAKPGKYLCTITAAHYSTGLTTAEGKAYDGDGPDTEFYVTVTTTDVKDVTTAKQVAGVQYFNIAGQASATPFEGVNMVVKTYTDGSKSVSKQILK